MDLCVLTRTQLKDGRIKTPAVLLDHMTNDEIMVKLKTAKVS